VFRGFEFLRVLRFEVEYIYIYIYLHISRSNYYPLPLPIPLGNQFAVQYYPANNEVFDEGVLTPPLSGGRLGFADDMAGPSDFEMPALNDHGIWGQQQDGFNISTPQQYGLPTTDIFGIGPSQVQHNLLLQKIGDGESNGFPSLPTSSGNSIFEGSSAEMPISLVSPPGNEDDAVTQQYAMQDNRRKRKRYAPLTSPPSPTPASNRSLPNLLPKPTTTTTTPTQIPTAPTSSSKIKATKKPRTANSTTTSTATGARHKPSRKVSAEQDPENHEILHLRTKNLLSWSGIATALNAARATKGLEQSFTEAAVYGRFVRTAPRIMAARGEGFDVRDWVHMKVNADGNGEGARARGSADGDESGGRGRRELLRVGRGGGGGDGGVDGESDAMVREVLAEVQEELKVWGAVAERLRERFGGAWTAEGCRDRGGRV